MDRAKAITTRLLQHTASLLHGRHELLLVFVNGEAHPYALASASPCPAKPPTWIMSSWLLSPSFW